MTPQKGKLYEYFGTVVMCTKDGESSEKRFAGVVVLQIDKTSDHRVGNYSETWTWIQGVFQQEYIGPVTLDNSTWKPFVEMGHSPG